MNIKKPAASVLSDIQQTLLEKCYGYTKNTFLAVAHYFLFFHPTWERHRVLADLSLMKPW